MYNFVNCHSERSEESQKNSDPSVVSLLQDDKEER